MPITLRDVHERELDAVLALNNAAGPTILPLDAAKLRFFWEHAEYFRVAEQEGVITGFLIALSQNAGHDSPNFRWFRERYPRFLYIDRIVIARPRQGHGRGRAFYADIQSFAEVRWPLLCCEVFLQPGSNHALLFHGSFGFREAGQQTMAGTGFRASMLSKELCSYPFVEQTYGEQLPEQPWLSSRLLPTSLRNQATGT